MLRIISNISLLLQLWCKIIIQMMLTLSSKTLVWIEYQCSLILSSGETQNRIVEQCFWVLPCSCSCDRDLDILFQWLIPLCSLKRIYWCFLTKISIMFLHIACLLLNVVGVAGHRADEWGFFLCVSLSALGILEAWFFTILLPICWTHVTYLSVA